MKKLIHNRFYLSAQILGGLVLLFILAPLLNLLFSSGFEELYETTTDIEVSRSIFLTLITSMGGTMVFAIFCIPLAFILARKTFWLKGLVNGIIDLPVVIPHTAAGIALLGVISRESLLGEQFSKIGINLVGTPVAISLAMAFVSVPFLINSARDGFQQVPVRLEKAALNLGASPARVFFTISLPLAWRNIISGMVMMFARGMSEFGAVVIVAYHPMITPVMIYERFSAFGLKYAEPVAVIFIVVCLVFFIFLRIFSNRINKNSRHA